MVAFPVKWDHTFLGWKDIGSFGSKQDRSGGGHGHLLYEFKATEVPALELMSVAVLPILYGEWCVRGCPCLCA